MSQDIISYKQKVSIVPDEQIMRRVFSDENLMLIVKALRKGPMTVLDLVEEFKAEGIKKSDKSVYRYLKDLIECKLVARAGKRITSVTEKDLQSETIYIRTAKFFLTGGLKHKEGKLGVEKTKKLFDLIFVILNKRYPEKITTVEGVKTLLNKFDVKKDKLLVDLLENADEEVFQKESELDWGLVQYLLEYVGWLALLLEGNIDKEIEDCCPK